MTFRLKCITFDCYGALTNFDMLNASLNHYQDKLAGERMNRFIADCSAYPREEIMSALKFSMPIWPSSC